MSNQYAGLYQECYERSANKQTIDLSHLPFSNGYYVTEDDIPLLVIYPTVYTVYNDTWVVAQHYVKLWYDSEKNFADIPDDVVDRLGFNQYEAKLLLKEDKKQIHIIEYFKRYREESRQLLDELQGYLVNIDTEHVQTISTIYQKEYLGYLIGNALFNNGKLYLALLDNHAVGLVAGWIEAKDKDDYLTNRCPKRGLVTELVVSQNMRGHGIGEKLLDQMEEYFKSLDCEFIAINVFAPNQDALEFYKHEGYSPRNIELYKRIEW